MAEGRSTAGALVSGLRPRQWLKNLLVFAAPLAAGRFLEPAILLPTIGAFVAFCLASSAMYLVNDVRDVEADRAHPVKRSRPVASGALSAATALVVAAVLLVLALGLGFWIAPALAAILAGYALMTLAYTLYLKNEAVIDLVVIAVGFLLRAIAGGVASDLRISNWFLIVAGFGSLFMAAGKRYSELVRVTGLRDSGEDVGQVRRSLAGYTPGYLRFVWAISAGVTVTAYCLWAFEVGAASGDYLWDVLSILPFVTALLRYALDVDAGTAEAPEEVVLRDPVLLVTGLLWLVVFGLGAVLT